MTVPEDAEELAAELRRHGVAPGQLLHVEKSTSAALRSDLERFDARVRSEISQYSHGVAGSDDQEPKPPSRAPRFKFVGAGHGAPSDLSERADEYLGQGFGGFGRG